MRRLDCCSLLLISLVWMGCGKGESSGPRGTDVGSTGESVTIKGTIGYSALTLTNPFFKVIADTMTEEALKHGYELIVVSGERDVKTQADQIDDFIVKGVAAIILNPCDSKSIGPAIKRANEKGIPVFTNDLAYDGKDAKVVCPQAESCQLRVKGFTEKLAAHNAVDGNPQINIVSTLDGGGAREEGFTAAKDALGANQDLAAIFAINDPSALGARAYLESVGKEDQVRIIGFDGFITGKQAILEGKIVCDPIQFPDQIGAITIEMIVKHFDGDDVEPEILIPSELYYKADAEADPALQQKE